MQLPWLLVQLVGYVLAWLAVAGTFAFLILSPPYFAGRYLWKHFRGVRPPLA